MTTSVQIGDMQPTARNVTVTSLPVSVVSQADIADIDSGVNSAIESGKREGAMVLMKETSGGKLVLVAAQGKEKNSPWTRQDTLAQITPA